MLTRTLRAYAEAAHFPPTVAVTAVTALLAVEAGRGPSGTAWAAVAVFAGQLSVGWSNDYIDRERDRAAERTAKPLVRNDIADASLWRAARAAFVVAIALSFGSGWRAALAHGVALVAAWSYNLVLKRTAISPVPYAVAFGLLPAIVYLGLAGHPWPPWWLVTAGALLGVGAHFVNVLPDLEADAQHGIRGLPHRIGARVSTLLSAAFLIVVAVVLAVAPAGPVGVLGAAGLAAGLAAGAVIVAVVARGGRLRVPFLLCLAVAAVDVVLLVLR